MLPWCRAKTTDCDAGALPGDRSHFGDGIWASIFLFSRVSFTLLAPFVAPRRWLGPTRFRRLMPLASASSYPPLRHQNKPDGSRAPPQNLDFARTKCDASGSPVANDFQFQPFGRRFFFAQTLWLAPHRSRRICSSLAPRLRKKSLAANT